MSGPSPDLYCPACDECFAFNDEHTTCDGSPTRNQPTDEDREVE